MADLPPATQILELSVTSAQADLCRVNPKDPFFPVVGLSFEAIHDRIEEYLWQFVEQYTGFHLTNPFGMWRMIGYGMDIQIFIYTETTGYTVKVHNMSNVKLLNLEELSAVLKWHFDPVESRGSMPLITDFRLLQSGGGSTEIG